jgi:hypothetical protein
MYTLGMMGMMNNSGNVHQKMMAKYGYGADFRNTPQAIQYSTEVLPIPQQNEVKKIPASFWSEMAKYYFF